MGEGNHATDTSGSSRKKWTLMIAGTAVVLLVAGVAMQVTRPTSAFPEDGTGGARQQPSGRATTADQGQKARIMAKVGNQGGAQVVTYDELAAECVQRHGKEILDNLINRKIIQQACDTQGVEISEAEVDAEVNKIAQKFHMDRTEYLKMLQAERNVTPAQYRRDIIWPMLALKKLAGEDVKITKDDLKKAFMRNYGPRVKAQAIVLDNQRRAAEIWKLANDNPEDFGKLAAKHSIDPSSRPLEGRVPPIPMHAGSPELEKAAFKLKEGEISAVIQVGLNHFIILKCEGQTEPAVQKMDEQIEQILREQLHDEKVQESVARVFQKIKDEARVDNYLTNTTTGGSKPTAAKAAGAAPGGVRPAGATAAAGAPGAPRKAAKAVPEIDADAEPTPPAAPKTARAPKAQSPK